ncbi:MAG: DUF2085 domain-containing protein [Anaerolineae bacterium]
MAEASVERVSAKRSAAVDGVVRWLAEHWLAIVIGLLILYAGLPWLAPVFMKLGWPGPAQAIYLAYSFMCHQLPQRSYFLFGPKLTYGLPEISAVWQWRTYTDLRQFLGTAEMGYKVAYGHRLMAIWTSVLAGSLLFGLARRRLQPLPFKWYLLLSLPMVIDGFSHLLTEAVPFLIDWRETNAWFRPLADLLGLEFSPTFYIDTTIGSLNWALRTLTGALFGLASVWFAYPYIERGMWIIQRSLARSQQAAQDTMTVKKQDVVIATERLGP